MSGETVATMRWRALDREGADKCRLAKVGEGWMLVGHARFREAGDWAALDYILRLDQDWFTTSVDVSGEYRGNTVAWRLVRAGAAWEMNGKALPDLAGVHDVVLGFTPATNLMPLRRLPEVGRLKTSALWLSLPGPKVSTLSQTYWRERGGMVRYRAEETDFETHLTVDPHGFVTRYPGFWDAE